MLSGAARVITEAIRTDESASVKVVELLIANGRISANSGEVAATIERFMAVVEGLLEIALTEAIEEDDEHLTAIRRFFLHPEETYSIKELAALWRVSLDDVRDIYHDEIAEWEISNEREGVEKVLRIKWAKAVGTTGVFSLLRPFDIERALGPDFINVRTERWRTVPILIHLPRFVANAFELDASVPPRLALANRIERVLELFTTENLIGGEANEARQP